MACRLVGTKLLPEPMLAYCKLDIIGNKFQWNWNRNFGIISIQENAFEIVVYHNGGHFVQVEMSW